MKSRRRAIAEFLAALSFAANVVEQMAARPRSVSQATIKRTAARLAAARRATDFPS